LLILKKFLATMMNCEPFNLTEEFMNLRKTMLAISLSACTGAVIAADKTPTLGEVLKASGIDVSGYIDTTYTNFSTDTPMYQANTTEKNSFSLNAVDLVVSSLPASGVGGMVEVMGGTDVAFNHSRGWTSTDLDLLQAYVQYASGGFTAMAGKFVTLAGAEVAQAPANSNVSRSLLYVNAIPVTHTGLRASYAPSDTMKFTLGYNNGWDIIKESAAGNCTIGGNCADGKTVELGAALNPLKQLSLSAMLHVGEEYSATSDAIGTRKLLDVVATFNATDALTFVLNYDKGEQDKATATAGTAKWDGIAGYANLAFADKWHASLRTEKFKDKDCFRTGCGFSAQTVKENTVTVGYALAKSTEVRAELRADKSDQKVYMKDGTSTDKQTFAGLELVYKY
jgi:hypothetical protein